jgi:hypothetical protein
MSSRIQQQRDRAIAGAVVVIGVMLALALLFINA